VRNKHAMISPQALLCKIKLIMSCEDPNYRITLASSPNGADRFGERSIGFSVDDRMQTKTNFYGDSVEMPAGHSYSTQEDLKDARNDLKRWSDELRERKTTEMELFNGKRELNINEGETASSISLSRVSNKQEKAKLLAADAQNKFGGGEMRKSAAGRKVQFGGFGEDLPNSPAHREGGSDDKKGIRDIDKLLAQNEALDYEDVDQMEQMSLAQLSRTNLSSRDDEALREEIEEEK
jgi:hypothetical protein